MKIRIPWPLLLPLVVVFFALALASNTDLIMEIFGRIATGLIAGALVWTAWFKCRRGDRGDQ